MIGIMNRSRTMRELIEEYGGSLILAVFGMTVAVVFKRIIGAI